MSLGLSPLQTAIVAALRSLAKREYMGNRGVFDRHAISESDLLEVVSVLYPKATIQSFFPAIKLLTKRGLIHHTGIRPGKPTRYYYKPNSREATRWHLEWGIKRGIKNRASPPGGATI